MIPRLFSRLRIRLLALVVLAAVPLFALLLFTGFEQRQQANRDAEAEAIRVARLAAFNEREAIEGASQLLTALAQLPAVRAGDSTACNALFADLLGQFPHYANFGVIELDGDTSCSGLPFDNPVNLADRSYFQRALESRDFAIGDYQIGRITGVPSVNFGYPVLDDTGEVEAVVFAALDLDWFNQLAAEAQLPSGSTLTVIDRRGTILARYPNPEAWTGQSLADEPLIQAILTQQEGFTEVAGLDGIPRIYGFTSLNGAPGVGYVSVGIPRDVAYAEANRILTQNLAGLAVVVALVLALGWASGERFVLRPVRRLVDATRRLSDGDLNTRVGVLRGSEEINQLARAFDEMAASLQEQATALIESEARYRLLAEQISDLVCLHMPDGTYLYLSPSCETLLGYPPDALVGTDPYQLFHPEDHERIRTQAHEPALQGEVSDLVIYRIRKQSGDYIWFETVTQPVVDDQGEVIRFVTSSRDVTERQHFTQRLAILRRIDQAILRADSPHAIAQAVMGHIQQIIPYRWTIVVEFDFDAQELVVLYNHNNPDIEPGTEPRHPLSLLQKLDELRQGNTIAVGDLQSLPQLGPMEQRFLAEGVRSYLAVPLMAQGELIGVFNLGADYPNAFTPEQLDIAGEIATQLAISLRQARLREQVERHAEELEARVAQRTEQLVQAKQHVEAILYNSSDAIILAELNGAIRQTNPAFDTLFGYQPDEMFGLPLRSLVASEDADRLAQALRAATGQGQATRIEITVYRKDGSTFPVDLALAPIRQHSSQVSEVVCSLHDITERKQVEANLRSALEQQRELTELKSRFASMVSHEFRNPLTAIRMSSDMLDHYADRMSEERKREHIRKIGVQVKRLADLMEDTLTISRAEAVSLDLNLEPLDLEAFCRDLVEEMQAVAGASHRIVFSGLGQCAEAAMDERLLRQMVTNLLSNAVKYSPKGSEVRVSLSCEDEQAILRVEDQGIGIPEEDQKRLFETFHRAKNVGDISGTGLGLAIVKRAVEAHGGTITFESQAGVGTTFTVHLPLSTSG